MNKTKKEKEKDCKHKRAIDLTTKAGFFCLDCQKTFLLVNGSYIEKQRKPRPYSK